MIHTQLTTPRNHHTVGSDLILISPVYTDLSSQFIVHGKVIPTYFHHSVKAAGRLGILLTLKKKREKHTTGSTPYQKSSILLKNGRFLATRE